MKNLFTRKLLKASCLLIAIVFASSSSAFAQVIITNGDPSDWVDFTTRFPGHSLISDTEPANATGNTDDQFTQGSKDEDLIQNWRWSNGSSNAKGDIDNAGAALSLDGCTLHFFVDRYAINGDAAIGFWFLKNPISKIAGKKFDGEHVDGDLLVLSHFTNGGGSSDIYQYKWTGNGPGSLVYQGTFTTAQVNTTPYPVPADWTYTPKVGATGTYPIGSFYEGEINLCAIFPNGVPCFATFVAETRNSQSITASLQDFALGGFTADVDAPEVTVTEPSLCGSATACVEVNDPQPGTYTLVQPNILNSAPVEIVFPGTNPVLTEVKFCDLVPGGGFSVYYSTVSGCSSEPTDCDNYLDGNTRYSAPKINPQTNVGKVDSKVNDLIAYPVPFSENVTVEFKAKKAENYVINLYDLQGHLIRELKAGNAKAGEVIKVEVSGNGMAESMYLVRKVSKSGTSTVKLLKKE